MKNFLYWVFSRFFWILVGMTDILVMMSILFPYDTNKYFKSTLKKLLRDLEEFND